jgi:hypothetical protein
MKPSILLQLTQLDIAVLISALSDFETKSDNNAFSAERSGDDEKSARCMQASMSAFKLRRQLLDSAQNG